MHHLRVSNSPGSSAKATKIFQQKNSPRVEVGWLVEAKSKNACSKNKLRCQQKRHEHLRALYPKKQKIILVPAKKYTGSSKNKKIGSAKNAPAKKWPPTLTAPPVAGCSSRRSNGVGYNTPCCWM
uniref:Uncharacterized protein n=1 Tax=Triticum urartu TaxID=4572 RepID=A0A8R7PY31_TRIUA